ncbi:MAG: hypothetical protein ACOVLB_06620 [Candidatus Nanopelagicus sp.]
MARSRLINTTDDLVTDSGAVLWSFVKGEQLEFPITMNFVENASAGYTYEGIVVEADNISAQTERPTAVKSNGTQTQLTIRVPTNRGNWDSAQAYNREEIVYYNGKYYKLVSGVARTNTVVPSIDTTWTESAVNVVYLQFPKTLSSTWSVTPLVNSPVYGFFELRVTEPLDSVFRRTWKPVRGMVEILFSPTYSVDD